MPCEYGLAGKVAAVTGGGGVLCGTIGTALAREGVRVALLDIKKAAAESCAEAIRVAGGTAVAVQADVLDGASVARARDEIERALGPVDILINGAGGNKKEATTSPEKPFFDLNILGTIIPSQVFGRRMAERKQGVILSISSLNSIRPLTRIPAYSAAKAAVSNFTQWLAVHMAQEYSPNVRVNAIAPGFFLTEQNRFLLTEEKTGALTPRGTTILAHTPMARFGDPVDLVGATLFLVSDQSRFVSGVVMPVDGGFSAFSGV